MKKFSDFGCEDSEEISLYLHTLKKDEIIEFYKMSKLYMPKKAMLKQELIDWLVQTHTAMCNFLREINSRDFRPRSAKTPSPVPSSFVEKLIDLVILYKKQLSKPAVKLFKVQGSQVLRMEFKLSPELFDPKSMTKLYYYYNETSDGYYTNIDIDYVIKLNTGAYLLYNLNVHEDYYDEEELYIFADYSSLIKFMNKDLYERFIAETKID